MTLPYTIEMGGITKAMIWTDISLVEASAYKQVLDVCLHPRLFKHASFMPDIHAGVGVPIGTVLPLKQAIIPGSVGVDIGCGMCAIKTTMTRYNTDIDDRLLGKIHEQIITRIPVGFKHRSAEQMDDVALYTTIPLKTIEEDYMPFETKSSEIFSQMGTLGGGNHFIELQVDDEGCVWIMLHSGSRNYGYGIAGKYIKLAQETCKDKIPHELKYFDTSDPLGSEYLLAMERALAFAQNNRTIMARIVKDVMSRILPDIKFSQTINIHHNYANQEKHFGEYVWVHRKGATKVSGRITGIIPGSMGSPSYIVRGKDTEESRMAYNSCSHGAGRSMSRGDAKRSIGMDDFTKQMEGIYSASIDKDHLDESPSAYKDIDDVVDRQANLISLVTRLCPILNIKG